MIRSLQIDNNLNRHKHNHTFYESPTINLSRPGNFMNIETPDQQDTKLEHGNNSQNYKTRQELKSRTENALRSCHELEAYLRQRLGSRLVGGVGPSGQLLGSGHRWQRRGSARLLAGKLRQWREEGWRSSGAVPGGASRGLLG